MTKKYKILFAGFLHPSMMTIMRNQLKQGNEITVIENYSSNSADLIKTLINEKPDVFFTCNDTSRFKTIISLLLNIPMVRIQEDPPQNNKWRASFLHDLQSPISYIHASIDLSSFGDIPDEKYILRLINSERVIEYAGSVPQPLTSYFWIEPIFIKDTTVRSKDIDIIFVGNIANWMPENLKAIITKESRSLPNHILDELIERITDHSNDFCAEIYKIENSIKGIDPDTYNSIVHLYYEAIGSLRRINVLRYITKEFADKYSIHMYGHESMKEIISVSTYKGYLHNMEEVKDVYRRSKIAIYNNSRPPLYNWPRFLEPYKYGCVGIVDYISLSDCDYERTCGNIGEVIILVPKIKSLSDLKSLIPSYLKDTNRETLINNVMSTALNYARINITETIHRWMCTFEYMNEKKDYSTYELEMLKYDSEVIEVCSNIIRCYQEINDIENAERFTKLQDYYLNLLKDGYQKEPQRAYQYAFYCYRQGDINKSLEIIDTACSDLHSAKILKARILGEKGQYQKVIDILTSFKSEDSTIESERLYFIGIALSRQDKFHLAIDYFKEITERYPTSHHLCEYIIGVCYFNMNNMHEAKSFLQKAFEKAMNYSDLVVLLGNVHFNLKEYDESVKMYQHALGIMQMTKENNEKVITVLEKLASSLLFKHDIMGAINTILHIIANYDKDHLMSHVKLFFILLSQNMYYDKAPEIFNRHGISLLNIYNDLSYELPDIIKEKITDNVMNLNIQDKIISDFKNGLKNVCLSQMEG